MREGVIGKAHKVLVRKPVWKKLFWKLSHRWKEETTAECHKAMKCVDVDWIQVTQVVI
jgi:hypothetical protein